MNFVQAIWAFALIVPLSFKPSPIENWGKSHEMAPMYPINRFNYKPPEAPSDSMWQAYCDSLRADSTNVGHVTPNAGP
jgi:hypothetical protein